MSIRLIEYDRTKRTVIPTEHCYTIVWLNRLLEMFKDDDDDNGEHIKVLAYVFYMSCPNPENPYFNLRDVERENRVLRDLQPEFDTEDLAIITAIDKLTEMYTTPVSRAYEAIAGMVDNMYDYLKDVQFNDGKDGNIASLTNIIKNFDQIRKSYGEVEKELAEETAKARGKGKLAYDQKPRH